MSSNNDSSQPEIRSLDDLVVTYDMRKLYAEARADFEALNSNRELLEQRAIQSFFNLEDPKNARN